MTGTAATINVSKTDTSATVSAESLEDHVRRVLRETLARVRPAVSPYSGKTFVDLTDGGDLRVRLALAGQLKSGNIAKSRYAVCLYEIDVRWTVRPTDWRRLFPWCLDCHHEERRLSYPLALDRETIELLETLRDETDDAESDEERRLDRAALARLVVALGEL